MEEKNEANLYGMALNDSVSLVDINGLQTYAPPGTKPATQTPKAPDSSANESGTTHVKVRACEIVLLDGHGFVCRTGKIPHTFEFADAKTSKGGFIGCWPGVTNGGINNDNRIGSLIMDTQISYNAVNADEISRERRLLWADMLKAARSDPNFVEQCPCVTLIVASPFTKGLLYGHNKASYDIVVQYSRADDKFYLVTGKPSNLDGYFPAGSNSFAQ